MLNLTCCSTPTKSPVNISFVTLVNRKSAIWSVIRVSSGNFLEMYDFMVFGYYAAAIGRAFFPSGNRFLSLMLR